MFFCFTWIKRFYTRVKKILLLATNMLNPACAGQRNARARTYLPISIVKEYTHHVCVKFQAQMDFRIIENLFFIHAVSFFR